MTLQIFEYIKKSKGINNYQLSKLLGVSASHIYYLENEAKSINFSMLLKLFDLSGLSLKAFWLLITKDFKDK